MRKEEKSQGSAPSFLSVCVGVTIDLSGARPHAGGIPGVLIGRTRGTVVITLGGGPCWEPHAFTGSRRLRPAELLGVAFRRAPFVWLPVILVSPQSSVMPTALSDRRAL